MKIKSTIPAAILTAAAAMLQEYVPELSPKALTDALESYNNDTEQGSAPTKPLTRKECAAHLGVCLNTINRYVRMGRLKANKISERLVRIDPQSVRDLLKCQQAEA